jgi:hypothetical protein
MFYITVGCTLRRPSSYRLLDVAMKFIDLVGSYDMPAKVREHADKVREEVRKEESKDERKKMEEALQKKKQEKLVWFACLAALSLSLPAPFLCRLPFGCC